MFLRKIIFLFSIIIIHFSFAQKRKKVDTVYVYEKVTVYDTVYLLKPLRLHFNDVVISQLKTNEIKIENKSFLTESEVEIKINNVLQYGIDAGIGLKKNFWSRENSNKLQFGEHLGAWISKRFSSNPKIFLQFSADVYHWNSTFDLDGTKEDTYLNGYYFTEDHQPLLFQRFNNKHFEYALQLKLFYEWKNIRPFAGILANHTTYKMQFLVPENSVVNKLDDFKNKQTNIGFSVGFQYRILKHLLIFTEYQQYKIKNISLKNSNFDFEIFKSNNTFVERKINVGISYVLSKL
jgi:hypothetical protein